ncbi:hypothetical protein LCG89_03060 [Enterococcus faecium]|uniref:hypothetical protein n=1 Tax=Enterococcus faecium TaxID=1352 RepID=UPI001CCEBC5B|nr:hypothetical protein [Enterococcus faecium]UBQ10494.1 hypothetical protein LCG89_03060 [Enterococcus faecium]BDP62667.1 hypothetical protein EfmJHP80_01630 [Enterococcus faecium]
MNDSIKKMLRITEKDLMITEVSYETLQKKKTLVVDAVLSPTPRACRSCGSTVVDGNGKAIIVKNGKKETIVRFEQYNHMPLVMRLKSNAIPVKTVAPIGRLKVILSNPDIQSQIMLDIKLLLY